MPTTLFPIATLAVRHGFILVQVTLCNGVVPAELDGDQQVAFYDTEAEAEFERIDAAEMRADAMSAADMEQDDDDDDLWIEPAVLHSDGALTLIEQRLTFSADALRELYSQCYRPTDELRGVVGPESGSIGGMRPANRAICDTTRSPVEARRRRPP